MRSCAYCGRDLGPEEKCTCRNAESARQAKNTESSTSGWQENTYKTGYTKKQKKKFRFKKPNFKKDANVVSGFTKRFVKDPINTISSPGVLSRLQLSIILLVTAIFVGMSFVFAYTKALTPIMQSIAPAIFAGYTFPKLLTSGLLISLYMLLGEFLFLMTLYLANRFLLRQQTPFFTFITRPVSAFIPLMVFSLIGALISFFTVWGTLMLILTGLVMNIVLTYEALRSEWSFMPAVKVMYLMSSSYFIFFVIVFNFLRVF